ncbi:undecaprenyl-diphosphatase UppP [Caloranaerobacter azorensis]|uniref:Undecaprenyl-diphosphatase n=1 Tax=Caloranaerobacter azorensis TaxID=116090 RepID=A0A6P1YBA2_9FIRM|nr:undecaprenyl-diphosphatase UppP [Caloranaerobacter azorensis]QIB26138.1 undecaprenyl-diphosphatase UppP [Caloranaerobacter azorensis]
MSLLKAIFLGIFQGITEFLPISSSGHLVLLQKLFNIDEGNLFFTVMLHFGTLISIFIVYFKDIVNIISEFIGFIIDLLKNKKVVINNEYRKLGIMIIIGSIPTALMGILLEDIFESFYNTTIIIGLALIFTGILLWAAEKIKSGKKSIYKMTVKDALIIGTFQGMAITPGLSRSGSTIVGGLFMGLSKKNATRFSFLLALPATFGASLLELSKTLTTNSLSGVSFLMVIVGIISSCITGIFAIKFLIKILEKGKLYYFSYYVWFLGLIVILFELIK